MAFCKKLAKDYKVGLAPGEAFGRGRAGQHPPLLRLGCRAAEQGPRSHRSGDQGAMMRPCPTAPSIDVRHLRKVYGEIVAVDDLTFAVPRRRACSACWAATARARPRPSPCCSGCSSRRRARSRAGRRHAEAPALRRPAAHELLLALCRPAASPDGAPEPAVLRPALRREGPRARASRRSPSTCRSRRSSTARRASCRPARRRAWRSPRR